MVSRIFLVCVSLTLSSCSGTHRHCNLVVEHGLAYGVCTNFFPRRRGRLSHCLSVCRKGKKKAVSSEERKLYMEPKYFESRIVDGDLHSMVTLHPGTDQNEWMATQSNDDNVDDGVV